MGASKSKVSIELHLERDQFFPGDPVAGIVRADVREPLVSNGIKLTLRCTATTMVKSFQYAEEGIKKSKERHAQVKELFSPIVIPLTPQTRADVAPGRYELPFEAMLPRNAPPSLSILSEDGKSASANIVYEIECSMLTAWRRKAASVRYTLNVGRSVPPTPHMDLRSDMMLRQWCCLERGPFSAQARINKTSFLDQDSCELSITASNNSTLASTSLKVKTVQHMVVRTKNRTEKWTEEKEFGSTSFALQPGEVLNAAAPKLVNCNVSFPHPTMDSPTVTVRSAIQIVIVVPGATWNPKIEFPVTTGFIPRGGFAAARELFDEDDDGEDMDIAIAEVVAVDDEGKLALSAMAK